MTTLAPGPTAPEERSLAPDLARGFMLLFIALANSHYFLAGTTVLGGYPRGGSRLDGVVTWFIATFVDGRAFPMFGLLFGYGVAQIARRQASRGPRGVRRLLWRRSAALLGIGVVDGLLFYAGDILAAYGVLLAVGVWAIGWKDRWLLVLGSLFLLLTALPNLDSMSISTDPPDVSMLPPDVLTMLVERLQVIPFIAVGGPIGFACPFLFGLWAGRRRVLEQVAGDGGRQHRLLRTVAVLGIVVSVLGAQPVALMLSGAVGVPGEASLKLIGPLHDATGVLGGLGYAALIALVSARIARPEPRPVRAIAAVGQRSMTCYLIQSPVWAVLFSPFLLDLSDDLSVAGTALIAVLTWLGSVLIADRLRSAGRRGPFEVVVRRITYGRPPVAAHG